MSGNGALEGKIWLFKGRKTPGSVLASRTAVSSKDFNAQDSDFDSLPDDWEILHFGDVASFGPDDDPDGDGNDNARELADGTDPDNISYFGASLGGIAQATNIHAAEASHRMPW